MRSLELFQKPVIIGSYYNVPKAWTAFQCILTRKLTKLLKINICLFQAVLLAGDALWTSEMIKKHIRVDTEPRKHTISSKTMFLNPAIFWHAPPYKGSLKKYAYLRFFLEHSDCKWTYFEPSRSIGTIISVIFCSMISLKKIKCS